MPTIAIVGVGAIGGALAGLLQNSNATHQITLCTRRPLPILRVDTPEGPIHVTAQNLTDPAQAPPWTGSSSPPRPTTPTEPPPGSPHSAARKPA